MGGFQTASLYREHHRDSLWKIFRNRGRNETKQQKKKETLSCFTFILGAAMTLNEAQLERSGHFIFDEDELQRSSTNRDVLIC